MRAFIISAEWIFSLLICTVLHFDAVFSVAPLRENADCKFRGRQPCCPGWRFSPLTRRCILEHPLNCDSLGCEHGCDVNYGGAVQCTCMSGFVIRRDGRTCEDVNECHKYPTLCHHGCQNTVGSFTCTCNLGYSLSDDGRNCKSVIDDSKSSCGGSSPCETHSDISAPELPPEFTKWTEGHLSQIKPGTSTLQPGILTRHFQNLFGGLEKIKDFESEGGSRTHTPCSGNNCDTDDRGHLTDCIGSGCPTPGGQGRDPNYPTLQQGGSDHITRNRIFDYENRGQQYSAGSGPVYQTSSEETPRKLSPASKHTDSEQSGTSRTGQHVQNDAPRCRDDLCNDPNRADQLLVTVDPTEQTDFMDFTCPSGYRLANIAGIKFCEPVETDDMQESVSAPTILKSCPDGHHMIRHPTGDEECVDIAKHPSNPHCPYGILTAGTDGIIRCEEPEPTDEITCPEGQVPIVSENGVSCQDGNTEPGRKKPYSVCPVGQVAMQTDSGFQCADEHDTPNKCPIGTVHQATMHGAGCVPMIQCGPGQILKKTNTGMSCQPLSTKPTESPCPDGLVPVKTSVGLVCEFVPKSGIAVKVETLCPDGEEEQIVDGRRTCIPQQADKQACPVGRILIYTDQGIVCGFESESSSNSVPTCRIDEVLVDGACVPSKSRNPCLPGQVFGNGMCLWTSSNVCGKGEELVNGQCVTIQTGEPCPPGATLIMGQCAFYVDKTCPPGEEQVMTATGDVMCQPVKGQPDPHSRDQYCGTGEVLSQTKRGFECLHDYTGIRESIRCDGSLVPVKLDSGHDCFHYEEVDILCEDDEIMIRLQSGFSCRRMQSIMDLGPCDHNSRQNCNTPSTPPASGVKYCEDGYEASVGKNGLIICRRKTVAIQCPDGFILSLTHSTPTCVPGNGPECLNEDGSVGPCLQYEHPGISSPCKAGYLPVKDKSGFIMCMPGSEVTGCGGSNCHGKKQGCVEDQSNGVVRPCDLDTEQLLAGCHPPCANGGTCNNDTCECPIGTTGTACQKDIDECHIRRDNCQHTCINTFGSFHCVCPDGFVLNPDGRTCARTGCMPDCLNGGVCHRGVCSCPQGFTGLYCEQDIDECRLYGDRLCQHHCRNTYGSYGCVCPPGSRLNADKRTCTNTTCIPACRNGGSCVDHVCVCPPGFRGIICQLDINECYVNNPCSHQCINTRGSYKCACPRGHRLNSDGKTCLR